ncbi:MAG: adenosylcobinamide-GDP ribazoletransferase [Holophaga sp.]|nr:adenosylcobinamide-GDP ribazoletransferase [Holophaga sp.]
MLASLVTALRFLTRAPIPGPESRGSDLGRSVAWFPLVGALVGLAVAGVQALGRTVWPAPVAAVLAVAFGLLLTGGMHEDGASDAADGLGGGHTPARVVEIMRDSRIGAYGAMTMWAVLSFRWAALVALDRRALIALPLAMAWGRWSMAVVMGALPPVSKGLASQVHEGMGRIPVLLASLLVVLLTLAAGALGWPRLWQPAAAAVVAVLAWILYLKQRMGGQTGDLLGAGNQVVETAVLLVLIAR